MTVNLTPFQITERSFPNNPEENTILGTNGSAFVPKYNNALAAIETGINQGDLQPTKDVFSGNSSQTVFSLTRAPGNTANVLVNVNGIYQNQTEYSISNTTITFNVAPPAGSQNVEIVVFSNAAFSKEVFATNGSTTTFILTKAPFSKNTVLAYHNGVYKNESEFNLVSNQIVFNTAPSLGTLEVIILR